MCSDPLPAESIVFLLARGAELLSYSWNWVFASDHVENDWSIIVESKGLECGAQHDWL